MTDNERIAKGECVSPLTTERCPVCVDRCEAFQNWGLNALLKSKIQISSPEEAEEVQTLLKQLGCKGTGFTSDRRVKWIYVEEDGWVKWDERDWSNGYTTITIQQLRDRCQTKI
ncbi:MAG: hypothetical protein ACO1OQ_12860 [Rufibacter sp.]